MIFSYKNYHSRIAMLYNFLRKGFFLHAYPYFLYFMYVTALQKM